MLTAAIGIDRAVEAKIGRLIAGNDCAATVGLNDRFKSLKRLIKAAPAIVARFAGEAFITPRPIARRTAPFAGLAGQVCGQSYVLCMFRGAHAIIVAQISNKNRTF
tara:strand:+ start:263 stop:580 length:318 start_codon:yes stop_codon:yes gene_type:complete